MTSRSRLWLAACALCAITLLAYANSFESGFVMDNRMFLLLDNRVHRATAENLSLIVDHTYWWPAQESGLYRPVTTLSYLFNYAILGNADRPAGYHWINLLLHAGNVLLVFALARRLVRDFWPSFLIAAIWAVHPVLTESVTYIVGRADLLAGMTILGGLLLYLKSTESSGWHRWAWLAGLAAITAVGVFCKENAVAVLGVVALYEFTWWNKDAAGKQPDSLRMGCLAMAPAFLAMWWMRSKVLAGSAPALFPFVDNPIVAANFWTGRLTAIKVMAKYLGLLVWPARLSVDYSYAQIPLADGRLTDWLAWIVVAGVSIAVALLYRRNKVAFFAAGFAFVTLLPTSNLVFPIGTIMAERFLYLPAVGLSICLTLALFSIARRLGAGALLPVALGLLIVAALGTRTWVRNADWKDDITFWSAAVRTSPLSFKTHTALALTMRASDLDFDRVLREDERGLAILDPLPDRLNNAEVYQRVATHYVQKGDRLRVPGPDGKLFAPPESISDYERARSILLRDVSIRRAYREASDPRLPNTDEDMNAYLRLTQTGQGTPTLVDNEVVAYLMLSQIDRRLGKWDEALRWARQSRAAGPAVAEAHLEVHDVLMAIGRRDEAIAALMEGILLVSNPLLPGKLAEDYENSPRDAQCAVGYAGTVPQINPSCPIVRKEACAVSADVVGLVGKTRGSEAAARVKNQIGAAYGCE
jgi:protein O-mannosyl-transferase